MTSRERALKAAMNWHDATTPDELGVEALADLIEVEIDAALDVVKDAIDEAVAEEREACAMVADQYGTWVPGVIGPAADRCINVARAIRARGAK